MYRVLFALLAGKAAGFSSMPDPGCTAVGPQTDAFPSIGAHFSPAGQASANFGSDTPCAPHCSAEFTITTAALEGATDVERFMSLADNPVLAAVAEAFNLTAGITYTPGCASGFPSTLCRGVGDDRYGWWSEICREAVGCSSCHDCFFPDGYPSECMQNRSGLPYMEFTPRAIFDYMPTTDGFESWMDQTGSGPCSEACAERPDENITVYGPGACPTEGSPYLCSDTNPYLALLLVNEVISEFPADFPACPDVVGGLLGLRSWVGNASMPPNTDHYGWGDPEGIAAVGCQPCSDCFFPQGYPPQGNASINAPPMIPYGPGYDSWPFKGAAWSPVGYTEWCSPFSNYFKPCDGSSPPETPDVEVSVVGGRRRKMAETKTGPKMSDQLAATAAKFSAIVGNGKK